MKLLLLVLALSFSLIPVEGGFGYVQVPGARGPPAGLPPDDTGLTGPPPFKQWEVIDLVNAILTNSLQNASLPDCSFMYPISGAQRKVTLYSNRVYNSYPPLKLLLDLPKSYVILNLKRLSVSPEGKWKISIPFGGPDIANGYYRAKISEISCKLNYRKWTKMIDNCNCKIGTVTVEKATGGSSPNSLKDILVTRTGTRRTANCIRRILKRGICKHFQYGT